MQRKSSKRKIISLICSVALSIITACMLQNSNVVEACDQLLLLESKYPGYWNYLREDVGTVLLIPPKNSNNLLISDINNQEINGVEICINDDRSITLNGRNTGDSFSVLLGWLNIPDGEYILSNFANLNSDIDLFIWADELNIAAANKNIEVFSIDNSVSNYHCALGIGGGALLNNVTIYPMISIDKTNTYCPFHRYDECDKVLKFNIDEKEDINDSDMLIFGHELNNIRDKYKWVSICYKDGTGMQFCDSKQVIGKLNIWGEPVEQ